MELCNMSILRKKHKIGKLTFPPSLFKPCLPVCLRQLFGTSISFSHFYVAPAAVQVYSVVTLVFRCIHPCQSGQVLSPIRSKQCLHECEVDEEVWFCSVSVLSFDFVNGLLSRSTLPTPWPIDTFYKTDEDWVMFEVCRILSSLKSTTKPTSYAFLGYFKGAPLCESPTTALNSLSGGNRFLTQLSDDG